MQTDLRFTRVPFLLKWVLANFLAGTIAGFLEDHGFQFAATLIFAGAIAGTCQWVVLRQMLRPIRWWPLASALGWIGGSLIGVSSYGLYRPIVDFLWTHLGLWEVFWLNIVTNPLPFAAMAIAQGLVLMQHRPFSTGTIGLWVLVSAIAGAVYGGVSASLCLAFCDVLPKVLIGIVAGGGWAGYGIITGLMLRTHLIWRSSGSGEDESHSSLCGED
jgi:hypothetical protein